MALRKAWLTEANIKAALTLYRDPQCYNKHEVAKKLGTTAHTIGWIMQNRMAPAEHQALKVLRYSKSKTGRKNPMFGKIGKEHHCWKGEVADGYGYLTILKGGKRQFVHRVVMAQALGLRVLPAKMDVHHIDNNPKNNKLDNLALVTRKGHQVIHAITDANLPAYESRKLSLWEAFQYMTLQSKTMSPTNPVESSLTTPEIRMCKMG